MNVKIAGECPHGGDDQRQEQQGGTRPRRLGMFSGDGSPLVTVVTVAFNAADVLERTILSVIEQDCQNVEYLVIDGGSTDGTLEVVRKYENAIDYWVSESDEGIYHAMNKAITRAKGEWLLFMNAGDVFHQSGSLAKAMSCANDACDVIYSDWFYRASGSLARANISKMNVRHQSVVYRRALHEIFGTYVVGAHVSISDFIFFLSISNRPWAYCNEPISVCDEEGVSANTSHLYQRIATEFIFGRRGRLAVSTIILLYPAYRFLKRQVLRKR